MKIKLLLFAFTLLIGLNRSMAQPGSCSVTPNVFYNGGLSIGGYASVSGATLNNSMSFIWDFGDGNYAYTYQFSHTYATSGVYNVCVTVFDSLSPCNATNCTYVTIGNPVGSCSAILTAYADTTNTVYFNVQTSGGSAPFTYSYNYGDGTTGISNTHTYATSGYYTACVQVADANGCTASSCDTFYVGTNNPPPTNCQANFNFYDLGNGDMAFHAVSNASNTNASATYIWDFGDGSAASGPYATHNYVTGTTYNVCLTLIDQLYNCVDTFCTTIFPNGGAPSQLCNAYFWLYPDSSSNVPGNGVWYAINQSSGSNLVYAWDFGDGSTSNQPFPTHTYAQPGNYVVCLTVVSAANGLTCTDSHCDSSAYYFRNTAGMTQISVLPDNSPTSIKKITENMELTMLPNPANTFITINTGDKTGVIRIYDVVGKEVKQFQLNGTSKQISVEDLPSGIYSVQFVNDHYQFGKKLIINR
jgi:PKD repeat protein